MENKEPRRLTYDRYNLFQSTYRMFYSHLIEATGIHWHEFNELAYISSGTGVHLLNGTSFPLRRGSLFLLTPTDFHELRPDNDQVLEVYSIIFSDEVIDDELYPLLFNRAGALMYQFEKADGDSMEAEFKLMWSEVNGNWVEVRRMLFNALERIFLQLIRASNSNREIRPDPLKSFLQPNVHRALLYLQHHFREKLTLEDVSKQAQLAPNYFSECFRKGTGVTFQSYLQDLRARFAQSLLLHAPNLSVTEVCFAAGFGSLSQFERIFKQRIGCTPKLYRKYKSIV